MKKVVERLRGMGVPVALNEPLKKHCTWKIGGPADMYLRPTSVQEVARATAFLDEAQVPWMVVGQGSNLLFDDLGFRGAVLEMRSGLSGIEFDGDRVTVGAGTWMPCLARATACAGLSGLEHAVGIPGAVGGVVVMNGGSLRHSLGDVVEWVRFVRGGDVFQIPRDECGFGYRRSVFQNGRDIVVAAGLRLTCRDRREVRREMLDDLRVRRGKFPLKYPNCGSVFSNDPVIHSKWGPPGKVVESCGLKGLRLGNAMVSHKHANFILNLGGATSSDVIGLVQAIRRVVAQVTGDFIPCEVRYVRPEGYVLPLDRIF
ncbi:MAG: UDP-N-acetylenolpyruvoylglucosamine reductase [Dethiosulfovibrio peptidovorans]|nr:MAG: UDP-N-acetylenolpyruvoylglucosamine reductase [Dethiosulfovibrio peptidovorans]